MSKIKNLGVRLGRRSSDYIAGSAASLPYEVINASGDWTLDLPTGEVQYGQNGDKMNCVTHSYHNSLETQANFFIHAGLMPAPHLKFLQDNGYIDANGKVNFNDRVGAILNGTTHKGNWLYIVADEPRGDDGVGLFPQECLQNDETLSWEQYYDEKLITPEILAIGKEFKRYFDTPYEFIGKDRISLMKHLKHAPIQVVIPGHAVVSISSTEMLTRYFDTYPPFIKEWSNPFEEALKPVLVIKELPMSNTKLIKIEKSGATPEIAFVLPATNQEALKAMAMNYGIQIPVLADGTVDWTELEKMFDYKLNI